MKNFLLLTLLLLLFTNENKAQTMPTEAIELKDSIEIMKDLMSILSDSEKEKSYFSLDVGMGNRIFNVRNNALNSKLTPVNTIVFSPAVVYHYNTGLYIAAGANLLNDHQRGFGFGQYSASGGYELPENDNFEFAIAYTHYFVEDKFSAYASPVQNDFYASLNFKRTWIKPGLAVGYSAGTYGDVKRILRLYDSTTNKIKSFSLIPSVSHEFAWKKVFNKKDGILFTPAMMANIGETTTAIHHHTNATNLANFLIKKGRLPKFYNTKFEPESMGLSLDATYVIGNFSIEPQGYFDYYLPATDGNRFSSYFTVTMRYAFQ